MTEKTIEEMKIFLEDLIGEKCRSNQLIDLWDQQYLIFTFLTNPFDQKYFKYICDLLQSEFANFVNAVGNTKGRLDIIFNITTNKE